ncbi:MAG: CARDB domain-containing protein, partial [Bacteroidota bacterium]
FTGLFIPHVQEGNYHLIVVIDEDEYMIESNEENNIWVSPTIQVTPPLADMTIASMTVDDTSLIPDQQFRIDYTLENQGTLASTFGEIKVWLSRDTLVDVFDYQLESVSAYHVTIGSNSTMNFIRENISLPSALSDGDYYIIMQLNTGTPTYAEINFDNNTAWQKINYSGSSYDAYDVSLDITSTDIDTIYGEAYFDYQLKNNTPVSTGSIDVSAYLSADSLLDENDLKGDYRSVIHLGPNSISIQNNAYVSFSGAGSLDYNYLIISSSNTKTLHDLDKSNNYDYIPVTYLPATHNFKTKQLAFPDTIYKGETDTLTYKVANEGSGKENFSQSIYLSKDTLVSIDDIKFKQSYFAKKPGSEATTITEISTYMEIPVGDYYLIVENTSNDDHHLLKKDFKKVHVSERDFDFSVSEKDAIPRYSESDSTLNFKVIVHRQGTDTATVKIEAVLFRDTTYHELLGITIYSKDINITGNSYTESISYKMIDTIAPGNYKLMLFADAENAAFETNEVNNKAYYDLYIGDYTDVQLAYLKSQPGTVEQGDTIAIETAILNRGNLTISQSNIGLYFSSDEVLDENDIPLGDTLINNLEAGDTSKAFQITYIIPSDAVAGKTYYVLASADAKNDIVEVDETNNISAIKLTIGEAPSIIMRNIGPEIKTYPNPVTSHLYIEAEDNGKGVQLEIISLQGQIILQEKLMGGKGIVNISSLSPGIYIVKTRIEESTIVKSIIKQ